MYSNKAKVSSYIGKLTFDITVALLYRIVCFSM